MRSFSAFSDTTSARNSASCVGYSPGVRSCLDLACVCSSIFNSTLDRLSYRNARAFLLVDSADDLRFTPNFSDILAAICLLPPVAVEGINITPSSGGCERPIPVFRYGEAADRSVDGDSPIWPATPYNSADGYHQVNGATVSPFAEPYVLRAKDPCALTQFERCSATAPLCAAAALRNLMRQVASVSRCLGRLLKFERAEGTWAAARGLDVRGQIRLFGNQSQDPVRVLFGETLPPLRFGAAPLSHSSVGTIELPN